ncbi:MAG: GNAT family N-acetyltransferase [Solirubrobacterales bacterium]
MTAARVLEPRELTNELTARWAEIQRQTALFASPFFHPAFTRLVAGARDDVRVAVLERDGDPVGFFPFQRGPLGVGRPVGSSLNDYQGVIADPDAEWEPGKLLRACGLRWFEFDHLIAGQEEFAPFHRHLSPSLVIDLSQGFEDYERVQREAGVKTIKRLRARWRKLERDHGPVRFEAHVADPHLLATLLAWKSAQYGRTGMADLLARPWFRQVIEAAHTASADGFAGLLSALWAGERPVALHLGLRSDSVWHYWLPAQDEDPELARCAPGLLLILAMAEHAERLGLRVLDFGKGEARHKREFANAENAVADGFVGTFSAVAAASRLRAQARELARRSAVGPRARRLAGRLTGPR